MANTAHSLSVEDARRKRRRRRASSFDELTFMLAGGDVLSASSMVSDSEASGGASLDMSGQLDSYTASHSGVNSIGLAQTPGTKRRGSESPSPFPRLKRSNSQGHFDPFAELKRARSSTPVPMPSAPAALATVKNAEQDLPLEFEWQFWLDEVTRHGTTKGEYEERVQSLGKFKTVRDFWRYWNHLVKVAEIPDSCNLQLFKSHIRPFWEDEENANGGKWIVRCPKNKAITQQYWDELVFAIIGNRVPSLDDICGVVLQVRSHGDSIKIWNKNKTDTARLDRMCKEFASVIGLPEGEVVIYQPHDVSITRNDLSRRGGGASRGGRRGRGRGRGWGRGRGRGGGGKRTRSGDWRRRDSPTKGSDRAPPTSPGPDRGGKGGGDGSWRRGTNDRVEAKGGAQRAKSGQSDPPRSPSSKVTGTGKNWGKPLESLAPESKDEPAPTIHVEPAPSPTPAEAAAQAASPETPADASWRTKKKKRITPEVKRRLSLSKLGKLHSTSEEASGDASAKAAKVGAAAGTAAVPSTAKFSYAAAAAPMASPGKKPSRNFAQVAAAGRAKANNVAVPKSPTSASSVIPPPPAGEVKLMGGTDEWSGSKSWADLSEDIDDEPPSPREQLASAKATPGSPLARGADVGGGIGGNNGDGSPKKRNRRRGKKKSKNGSSERVDRPPAPADKGNTTQTLPTSPDRKTRDSKGKGKGKSKGKGKNRGRGKHSGGEPLRVDSNDNVIEEPAAGATNDASDRPSAASPKKKARNDRAKSKAKSKATSEGKARDGSRTEQGGQRKKAGSGAKGNKATEGTPPSAAKAPAANARTPKKKNKNKGNAAATGEVADGQAADAATGVMTQAKAKGKGTAKGKGKGKGKPQAQPLAKTEAKPPAKTSVKGKGKGKPQTKAENAKAQGKGKAKGKAKAKEAGEKKTNNSKGAGAGDTDGKQQPKPKQSSGKRKGKPAPVVDADGMTVVTRASGAAAPVRRQEASRGGNRVTVAATNAFDALEVASPKLRAPKADILQADGGLGAAATAQSAGATGGMRRRGRRRKGAATAASVDAEAPAPLALAAKVAVPALLIIILLCIFAFFVL